MSGSEVEERGSDSLLISRGPYLGPVMCLHLTPGQIPFYPSILFSVKRGGRLLGSLPAQLFRAVFHCFKRCGSQEFGADEVENNTWNPTPVLLTKSRLAVLTVLRAALAGGAPGWRPRLASPPPVGRCLPGLEPAAAGLPFVWTFQSSRLLITYYVPGAVMWCDSLKGQWQGHA